MFRLIIVSAPIITIALVSILFYRNPGTVIINWLDYKVYTTLGFTVFAFAMISILLWIIFSIIHDINAFCKSFLRLVTKVFNNKQYHAKDLKLLKACTTNTPEQLFKIAGQYYKDVDTGLYLQAKALILQSNIEQSEEIYHKFPINSTESNLLLHDYVTYYWNIQDYDNTIDWARKIIEIQPNNIWLLNIFIRSSIALKQPDLIPTLLEEPHLSDESKAFIENHPLWVDNTENKDSNTSSQN